MLETRTGAAPRATLDHLVVAATTLADGIDYVASLDWRCPAAGRQARRDGHAQCRRAAG